METWKLPDDAVTVQKEGHMVHFLVNCRPPCEPSRLLRCYGESAPQDLLVGVLEPRDGLLTLDRRISRETLRQAGIVENLPVRFYLSDGGARERAAETCPPAAAQEERAAVQQAENSEANTSPPAEAPAAAGVPESAVTLPQTGDGLLDAVLARGEAYCEPSAEGFRITCPFSSGQPFALAFIAPLCRAENGVAILDWKPANFDSAGL